MTMTGVTDRRRGRGLLLAALAAVGVLAGVAAEAQAQDVYVRDQDGGVQRAAYFQTGKRGRDGYDDRSGYASAPGYGGAGGGYRRGQVLPPDQRGRYVDDPGRYHLRAAPNGYGWVGDGRNAYLMQRSTGMVLDSVPGAYEAGPRGGGGRPYPGGGGRGYQGEGGGRGYEGGGGGRGPEGRGGGGRQGGGGGGQRGRR
jgi:Ni/Co efflux regulator RcnB